MSFILDALRKSERERQRSAAERLRHSTPEYSAGAPRTPWGLIIGAILLLNGLLVFFFWWRTPPAQAPQTVSRPAPITEHPTPPQVRSLEAEARSGELPAGSAPAPTAAIPAADPKADANVIALSAPLLADLPADIRGSLPDLQVNVHSYSADPAQRFVLINMRRYREGDTLPAGPRVLEINVGGLVLEYRGRHFFLPRT